MTGLNGNIGMDYENLNNTATTLSNKISEYSSSVKSLFDIVDDMRTYWEGTAGEESLQKVESYRPLFTDLEENLSRYPATIIDASNRHKEADMEAVARARRL